MSNNDTRISGAAASEKKRKTHVAICLSFLAIVFVGIIIAAIVIGINGGFDTKINGKTPAELYESASQAINSDKNHTVNILRVSQAYSAVGQSTIDVEMCEEITSRVDGDNFYYRKITTTTYKAGDKETPTDSFIEITCIGDTVYLKHDTEKQIISRSELDSYLDTLSITADMILDVDGIFEKCEIKSADGAHTVTVSLTDEKYEAQIVENAKTLFAEENKNLRWIWSLYPVFSNEQASAAYDDDGKLISTSYGYTFTDRSVSYLSGSANVSADISYGNAEVTVPADADEFN